MSKQFFDEELEVENFDVVNFVFDRPQVAKQPLADPYDEIQDELAQERDERLEAKKEATAPVASPTADTSPAEPEPQPFFLNGKAPVSAADLMRAVLPKPKWAIEDLLPEGLTIMAGKPKLGKSLLMMNLCGDLTDGKVVFDRFSTTRSEALYLALEDPYHRLQHRLCAMFPDGSPNGFSVAQQGTFGRIDEGGLDQLEAWVTQNPACRIVVIDTLARFKGKERFSNNAYQQDADFGIKLQQFAFKHHLAVVVVHHLRKAAAEDWFDTISGTTGLTGVADCVMVLQRERGSRDAVLKVGGRDISEIDLALSLNPDTLRWKCVGEASDVRLSAERQSILECIKSNGPSTPKVVAERTGLPVGSVRHMMPKMAAAGLLSNSDGTYSIPELN